MPDQSWVFGRPLDHHELVRELAWLRPQPGALLQLPGCEIHMRVFDAQGRCPVCHDLGVKPSWW